MGHIDGNQGDMGEDRRKKSDMEDIKYLLNGQEVVVVEKTEAGYLFKHIFNDDDDEEGYIDGDICFAVRVYDTPPAEKQSELIVNLRKIIEELRNTKSELQRQITEIQEQEKTRLKRYAQYEQLRHLDDFLNARITHYAILEYDPKIIEFKDTKCEYNVKDLKLLTLFGGSDGNLNWKLNRYSDGSGGSQTVMPCLSYQNALDEIQKYIDDRIDKNPSGDLIKSAEKYGLKVKPEYKQAYIDQQKESLNKNIAEHKESMKKTVKKLKDLQKGNI